MSQSVAVHKRSQYDRNASLGTLWYRRLLTALLLLIPSRGYWFFENLRGSIEDKFPCRYFWGQVKNKNETIWVYSEKFACQILNFFKMSTSEPVFSL